MRTPSSLKTLLTVLALVFVLPTIQADDATKPIAAETLIFAEKDGMVAVEAEHFVRQELSSIRAFHITTSKSAPAIEPDGDPSHIGGAAGGAYVEILPDSRRNHGEKLIKGENFSDAPGKLAVLTYKVHFQTPGTYYVWVRAFSSGSEDNGLHVGINGTWPDSGKRMQWCEGKKTWRWESKQRTEQTHCGEPYKIFLEVPSAGVHEIHFSMREDGFEIDRWLMTTNREFARPDGIGPKSLVHEGTAPAEFDFVEAPPLAAETTPAPMADPIGNARRDALAVVPNTTLLKDTGFYLDKGKWAAINPDQRKSAAVETTLEFPTGQYDVCLEAVGENDGGAVYHVQIGETALAKHECPLSDKMFEEDSRFHQTWKNIAVATGDKFKLHAEVGSKDGAEFSRARWAAVTFTPADEATRKAAAPMLATMRKKAADSNKTAQPSPTKASSDLPLQLPRQPDGDGSVEVSGELKQWHKVTLTQNGPYAHELDNTPNPFVNYEMNVTFTHESGSPKYVVPGYFAADGKAGETSAQSGTKWRAHLSPDKPGRWDYAISFKKGTLIVETDYPVAEAVSPADGKSGSITIAATDKTAPDLRSRGRLQYVGERYLKFAGTGEYFLKAGPDAPETLLGYSDFDNTVAGKAEKVPLKTFKAHLGDWKDGDPTWKDGKGKGLIGAINYLSEKGCNVFSFLPYNAGGDGDNVWPFVQREDKLHYDCSKLDQWSIVFDHGTARGMYLHFKLQENEIDDNRLGHQLKDGVVPESLDGGRLGIQRRLYCRELIARFGHALALNWNLGEENTQSTAEQIDMAKFLQRIDPYDHLVVVHTFPDQQDKVYPPLLGDKSSLTGASLQNSWSNAHQKTLKWVTESAAAGRPWVVCNDEQNPASLGVPPDPGYQGHDGIAIVKKNNAAKGKSTSVANPEPGADETRGYTMHDVRKQCLWGTLMAGGAGVEYYFGYQLPQNDLICEDFRSRDKSWDYCRIALEFFRDNKIPIQQLQPSDPLVGHDGSKNSRYCLAKSGELYLVYIADGQPANLDLSGVKGEYTIEWFNPRAGGAIETGSVTNVTGGSSVSLGLPPKDHNEDWLAIIRLVK